MNKLYMKCERNAISNADYLFYLTCLGSLSQYFSHLHGMFNIVSE